MSLIHEFNFPNPCQIEGYTWKIYGPFNVIECLHMGTVDHPGIIWLGVGLGTLVTMGARIRVTWKNFKCTKILDYENTSFRWRICHMLGHLQGTCPHARAYLPRKK
jgi:hypothetical protein